MTVRAAVYLRISLDRAADGLAIDRQRQDCERIARERGWTIVGEYPDTVSASDKRKDRPQYDRLVGDFAARKFDALIVWDLDRLTRQPRQLEDWIDAAEERGLKLVTANGEADLSTDGGRLFARIKASVARAEVERKSARQARAALQRSERGKPPMGVRLTGYTPAGDLVPSEARVIADVFRRFAAGESLKGLAAHLEASGVATRRGGRWNPSTVRTMLLNPRYAGRAIYRGVVTGVTGGWEPIVDDETFAVVMAKLADPRRRTQQGTDRKYLGSSLYRCGAPGCDRTVYAHSGNRYRCPVGGHLTRMADSIDEYVEEYLRALLAGPQLLATVAAAQPSTSTGELMTLRTRLLKIEQDYDDGLIDGRRYQTATGKVRAQIAAVERVAAAATGQHSRIVAATDPVSAYEQSSIMERRAVLELFLDVTLLPAERGRKFEPATVVLAPRR